MFNDWAVWTVAPRAAAGQWKNDKRRALKERDDDPSAGIAGPDYDQDDAKQLQWLYPREVLVVASCPDVPLAARGRWPKGPGSLSRPPCAPRPHELVRNALGELQGRVSP